VNTSRLLKDDTASFLFCIPLPNEYLCSVISKLITQPIKIWHNAYLIQEVFVFLSRDQINPEKLKDSYLENFSKDLDLSYLSIQDLVIRSIQQLIYYAQSSQLDTHQLPSELVLIFDKYEDINNGNTDNVDDNIEINTNELLTTIKLTLQNSSYSINNFSIWFTNKSYLPSSTKYSLDSLSLYLVKGFDDNLLESFLFSKSKEFNVRDFIIDKVNNLNIETVLKPYF